MRGSGKWYKFSLYRSALRCKHAHPQNALLASPLISFSCFISHAFDIFRQFASCCCRGFIFGQSVEEQTCSEQKWGGGTQKWSKFTIAFFQVIWRATLVSTAELFFFAYFTYYFFGNMIIIMLLSKKKLSGNITVY